MRILRYKCNHFSHTHTTHTHTHTNTHTHTHTHKAVAMTLRTVLLSIQALLQAAEPDDLQDAVVVRQYKEDPELCRKTAIHWAQVYAGGEFTAYLPFPSHVLHFLAFSYQIFLPFLFLLPSYYNFYLSFYFSPPFSFYSLSLPSLHTFIKLSAPKNSKLDNEFEDKLQQLLTMGISEVWSYNSLVHKMGG